MDQTPLNSERRREFNFGAAQESRIPGFAGALARTRYAAPPCPSELTVISTRKPLSLTTVIQPPSFVFRLAQVAASDRRRNNAASILCAFASRSKIE
jgi:hypothetical protein